MPPSCSHLILQPRPPAFESLRLEKSLAPTCNRSSLVHCYPITQ